MSSKKKKNFLAKSLVGIETVGNKLPNPAAIFVILSLIVIVISEIAARVGLNAEYLGFRDGQQTMMNVKAVSLMNTDGIRVMFTKAVGNFTSFAPLGTVLVAMLGVGVADSTGLIGVALKALVLRTPKRIISAVVVFAGIMSNMASDAGYVILIPLGAMIFMSMGRHPLAGLAAGFAGVSAGFSANIVISTLDPLLSGISTSAAQIINSDYVVIPTSNYYFMLASVPFLTIIGAIITDKIVEPMLGEYKGKIIATDDNMGISAEEKKGLKWAFVSGAIFFIIMAICVIPTNGILRGPNGEFLTSPFISAIVPIMALAFFIPGVCYGIPTGTIKGHKDVIKYMSDAMSSMGLYMVLSFFAAQFVFYFSYSNLGTILSVNGAEFLKNSGFTGIQLVIAFVIVTAFLNLFIGSASAKWSIMAPVFIPMLMQIGYTPEFVQLTYRIGDSVTNIISPLLPYFAMVIVFANKYDVEGEEPAGLGTIVSMMLPYSMIFLVFWTLLLIIWFMIGLPIGIGGAIRL